MRRLRQIDDLRLRTCGEDVDAMPAVPGGRRCASCRTTVHDLSALTRRAAERLVAARAGQPTCYRYLADDAGALVFAREPARPGAPLLALALAACAPPGPPPRPAMDETPAESAAPAVVPRIPADESAAPVVVPRIPADEAPCAPDEAAPPSTSPAKPDPTAPPQHPADRGKNVTSYAGAPYEP